MTLREEALFELEQVPDFKLSELIHYMRFLKECPNSLGQPDKPRGRPRNLLGALKGKIWVSDDCFEPMELIPRSEFLALQEKAEKAEALQKEAVV